jgi:hypothetical protein
MPSCSLHRCGRTPAEKHIVHKIYLCSRCRVLVSRYGYPHTLGDLSNFVTLAVLEFGPEKVRAALARLEETQT